ncbi:hypothetical protein D9C73_015601 [Collichthys lucidus]|uniref:Uncharacterized protein n=1 Tax=Collichthys lucidus TaxID=240159 RepID=A0A4U5V1D3_COLLU|nr:hypothetical protein D9C73_015601 [Collichthys lucidus]
MASLITAHLFSVTAFKVSTAMRNISEIEKQSLSRPALRRVDQSGTLKQTLILKYRRITARLSSPVVAVWLSSPPVYQSNKPVHRATHTVYVHRKCPESDYGGRQHCPNIGTGLSGGFQTDKPESPAPYPQH